MKLRRIMAAVVATAITAALSVSAFAATSDTIKKVTLDATSETGKIMQWPLATLSAFDTVDTITVKGVASVDGWCGGGGQIGFDSAEWVQVDFALDGSNVTLDAATGVFTAVLDFGGADLNFEKEGGIMQLGWWWGAGAQKMELTDLLVNGTSVIGATVPADEPVEDTPAVETAEAPAEETVVVEDTAESVEETVEIIESEEAEPVSTDIADYFDGSTVILHGEEGGYLSANDMALTDVYGVKYYVTFDDAEVADENVWVGGGVGANSDSTGWEQHEWGKASGAKEITPDFENGTITWYNGEPIFTEDETYAQLWIQTWGGTVTVDSVELLYADYVPETPAVEDEPVVDTEAPTTGDKQSPDTGVEGIAAVAGIVALAGAAVVASRKRK